MFDANLMHVLVFFFFSPLCGYILVMFRSVMLATNVKLAISSKQKLLRFPVAIFPLREAMLSLFLFYYIGCYALYMYM